MIEDAIRTPCPDCGRHYARNYLDDRGCDRIRKSSKCAESTITKLGARVAELELALDGQTVVLQPSKFDQT